MTLRITVEVVPFGNEAQKYPIHTINISNTGKQTPGGAHRYNAMIDGEDVGLKFLHRREHGALMLLYKVLTRTPHRWNKRFPSI